MIYPQSYRASQGNYGTVFAGEHQLFNKRSGDVGGICIDPSGNLYAADPIYHIILKITTNGQVIVWAGKTGVKGNNGNVRVKGSDALFNEPTGVSIDKSGNLYIADKGNNQIRRISPDQYVSLVAGSPSGASGYRGGIGTNVLFNSPNDISVDKTGNIYVADTNNHAVRLIQNGTAQVNTVAGNGKPGDGYGVGLQSILRYPYSVAVKPSGDVYIMDSGNYKIKLMNKSFYVLRFSGSGIEGSYLGDALTSRYNDLYLSDVDASGNLYVIDFRRGLDSRLLKINGNGIPAIVRDFASLDGNWVWEDGQNAIWEDTNNAIFDVVISEDNNYVAGVAVNNTGVLYIAESEYGGI